MHTFTVEMYMPYIYILRNVTVRSCFHVPMCVHDCTCGIADKSRCHQLSQDKHNQTFAKLMTEAWIQRAGKHPKSSTSLMSLMNIRGCSPGY